MADLNGQGNIYNTRPTSVDSSGSTSYSTVKTYSSGTTGYDNLKTYLLIDQVSLMKGDKAKIISHTVTGAQASDIQAKYDKMVGVRDQGKDKEYKEARDAYQSSLKGLPRDELYVPKQDVIGGKVSVGRAYESGSLNITGEVPSKSFLSPVRSFFSGFLGPKYENKTSEPKTAAEVVAAAKQGQGSPAVVDADNSWAEKNESTLGSSGSSPESNESAGKFDVKFGDAKASFDTNMNAKAMKDFRDVHGGPSTMSTESKGSYENWADRNKESLGGSDSFPNAQSYAAGKSELWAKDAKTRLDADLNKTPRQVFQATHPSLTSSTYKSPATGVQTKSPDLTDYGNWAERNAPTLGGDTSSPQADKTAGTFGVSNPNPKATFDVATNKREMENYGKLRPDLVPLSTYGVSDKKVTEAEAKTSASLGSYEQWAVDNAKTLGSADSSPQARVSGEGPKALWAKGAKTEFNYALNKTPREVFQVTHPGSAQSYDTKDLPSTPSPDISSYDRWAGSNKDTLGSSDKSPEPDKSAGKFDVNFPGAKTNFDYKMNDLARKDFIAVHGTSEPYKSNETEDNKGTTHLKFTQEYLDKQAAKASSQGSYEQWVKNNEKTLGSSTASPQADKTAGKFDVKFPDAKTNFNYDLNKRAMDNFRDVHGSSEPYKPKTTEELRVEIENEADTSAKKAFGYKSFTDDEGTKLAVEFANQRDLFAEDVYNGDKHDIAEEGQRLEANLKGARDERKRVQSHQSIADYKRTPDQLKFTEKYGNKIQQDKLNKALHDVLYNSLNEAMKEKGGPAAVVDKDAFEKAWADYNKNRMNTSDFVSGSYVPKPSHEEGELGQKLYEPRSSKMPDEYEGKVDVERMSEEGAAALKKSNLWQKHMILSVKLRGFML